MGNRKDLYLSNILASFDTLKGYNHEINYSLIHRVYYRAKNCVFEKYYPRKIEPKSSEASMQLCKDFKNALHNIY